MIEKHLIVDVETHQAFKVEAAKRGISVKKLASIAIERLIEDQQ